MRRLSALAILAGLALPQAGLTQDVSHVDRATLGCAGGVTTCSGQTLRPEEIRFVLGLPDEAAARAQYVALYGDPARPQPDVGFGRYRTVAQAFDYVYSAQTCAGQHEPHTAGGEVEKVIARGPQGGIVMGDGQPLYRYEVTPTEFMLLFDLCGPFPEERGGLPVYDWVGEVSHVFSADGPDAIGESSTIFWMAGDRMVGLMAGEHAIVPRAMGGREDWLVTLYERFAAEDGSPVTPRTPVVTRGGGDGGAGGAAPGGPDPADLPPLPVPFDQIETAQRDPGSACQTLANVLVALEAMGATDHAALIRAEASREQQNPARCEDILQILREADAAAGNDPQAGMTPPFLHQLFGPVARP